MASKVVVFVELLCGPVKDVKMTNIFLSSCNEKQL